MDVKSLLTRNLPEEDVLLLRGETITVRGLSRLEVMTIRKEALAAGEGWAYRETSDLLMLHFGVLRPALTKDDVREWQANARSGELDGVIEAITKLSGLDETYNKETYKRFRGQRGDGVGVLPSGEAEEDGSQPSE